METKVYYPQTIQDQPFIGPVDPRAADKSTKTTYFPSTISSQPLPTGVIASTIINSNLNTQSRQILGGFTFGRSGAIQIGTYQSGVSGDIRISPNGIVGRNSSGQITFSIDGTTGSPTFRGTLAAGSVIAGSVTVDWAQIQNVSVTNANIVSINANKITAGTLDADRIGASSITASKLNVSSLSAISANMGTLTAGSITGGTITGVIVTGGTVRSSSTSTRVELDGSNNWLGVYDTGVRIIQLDSGGGWVRGGYNWSLGGTSASGKAVEFGYFSGDGELRFQAVGSTRGVTFGHSGGSPGMPVTMNNALTMQSFIDLNGNNIEDLGTVLWQTRSSNPSNSWALYMYQSGGTHGLRTRMNGVTWQVDQSSP